MRKFLIATFLLMCGGVAHAQFMPEKLTPMGEKIEAAMKSDIRTPEEKARDGERKPRQTLEFFGLRDDMRVLELIPSGGWYTKILAPVLADKGELHVAIGTGRAIEPMIKTVPALAKVKVAPTDAKFAPAAGGQMGKFELGEFYAGREESRPRADLSQLPQPDTGSPRQPQPCGVGGAEIRWHLRHRRPHPAAQ